MQNRGGTGNPLDELRRINEKVASQKSTSGATPTRNNEPTQNTSPNRARIPQRQAMPYQTAPNTQRPASQFPSTPNTQRRNPAPSVNTANGTSGARVNVNPSNPYVGGMKIENVPAPQNSRPQGISNGNYQMPRTGAPQRTQASSKGDTIYYKKNLVNPNMQTRVTPTQRARPQPGGIPTGRIQEPEKSGKSAKKDKKNGYIDTFDESVGKGVVSSAVKAVIYIVCVLVVSGCLALVTILIANDAFAFVKTGDEVKITLSENASLGDIASTLHDNGVIKYPSMFKLYCKLRHKTSDNYLSGEFTVAPTMGYDALISEFLPNDGVRTELTITLIEGMNVDEMIDTFVENGIGTREGFIDVIQNYDFDFWFVDELDAKIAAHPDSGRKYRLEGYLFPDTYNFYNTASEADVIYKLLDNFNSKFDEAKRQRAQSMGYTTDQIVTMASMIQKEAKYVSDYGNVSSVFYNRLNKGQSLESNATVQYMMPSEEVELKLTRDQIDKYDSAYNTYLHTGLPVGAICNPSLNSLNWALYPNDTNYYYFVSDALGYNLYAASYAEHERNCAKVEQETSEN